MRIPTLAVTLAAGAAVVALPTGANAAAPNAVSDSLVTRFQTAETVNVLTNDTDADGQSLTVTGQTNGDNGTASCTSAGVCTYTPNTGFAGTDNFTYTVTDGTTPMTGTVTVLVDVSAITVSSTPPNLVAVDNPDNLALRNPSHKVTGLVTAGGVPKSGVQVQLYSRTDLADDKVAVPGGLVTSDADGKIVVPGLRPVQKTYYSWRSLGGRSSTERSVTVTPFVTTKYSPSQKFAKGQSVTVTGVTGPVTEGQDVVLQQKLATGWTEVETKTVQPETVAQDNSAEFAFATITHNTSGAFLYRVLVPEVVSQRELGTSGQTTVNVYAADITGIQAANSDEFVTIKNPGKVTINLKDWRLADSNTTITLPKRAVAAGGIVKVHTGKGTNDSKNLYLGKAKGTSLWANSGTVTLKDNADPRILMDTIQYPA